MFAYPSAFYVFGEENWITFSKGKRNYGYWRIKALRELADKTIEMQLQDKSYIDELIKVWQEKTDYILSKMESKEKLFNGLDQGIVDFMNMFHELLLDQWTHALIFEIFDVSAEDVISELLQKNESKMSISEFIECCLLDRLTTLQKEEQDLQLLAEDIISSPDNEGGLIDQHIKKYYWIRTNFYETEPLSIDDVIKRIEQGVSVDHKHLEQMKKRKNELIEKYQPNEELKSLIYFFTELSNWRELRKECVMKTNYFIAEILSEIARRVDVEYMLLLQACTNEVEKIFEKSPEFLEELKKRQAFFCAYTEQAKLRVASGKEALKYINAFEQVFARQQGELCGTVVSSGLGVGEVKILYGEQDFYKFKAGDIIVALMTRPEYIPLMKNASAIITEEGGLTCHAAIVSRELNIPCIVGVQNATTALRDGMLVKVDADNGKLIIQ
ncbi:MAG: hypothetical protein KKG04_06375 [Candidatus Thermoplasmatota archaeon]|nr:hypothetical protein [Candidatus Thermoplasmatota archaeon]